MALPHAQAGEKVHLESVSSTEAKTAALVKTDRFEAARLVLASGATIQRHSVPGHVILYCIEGSVVLDANRQTELESGDWIYLDRGEEHGLRATSDSSLLLTVLFDS
jgi:quercetin dioxygenase-like cupin family protein